jgi:hypothetical protein
MSINFSGETFLRKYVYIWKKTYWSEIFFSRVFFALFISVIFLNTINVFASTSTVPIDSAYHHAWGENVGWVDFSLINIDYASTTLSGYAYGENIGFISLNCKNTGSCISNNYAVTNNNYQGVLGGYAWGENVGWIDFSHVAFSTSTGVFSGYAYGENIGNIVFGPDNNKVVVDWVPPLATSSPITSCGTIVYSGTYTLGSDITDNSGACFTVLADNVIINGLDPIDHTTIHSVTGNGSDYGVDARGVGSGESGYSVTLENISLNNFSNGISTNANANGNGNGGSITITDATIVGAVSASKNGSGQNGTVAINNSTITIPSSSSWTLNDGGTGNIWIFNGNSFNTGTIHGIAKFYGTSEMQSGTASVCNFYEASSKTGGTCGTIYNLQPYYFAPTSNSLWNNGSNWYWKSGNATTTVPVTASSTPQAQDSVYLGGSPTSIPNVILSSIYVATSTQNTGDIAVDLTNLTGPNTVTNFYNGHSTGNVQGTINLFNNLSLSHVEGTGTFDPNIVINFYGTSHNDLANAPGTLNFFGHSYNAPNGASLNTPNFYDSSYNQNTLQSAIFGGDSSNVGTSTNATFNGSSTNSGSVGVANFNNNSHNAGTVGQASFGGSSYNIGTSSVATFIGDLSENFYQATNGFVSGVKTRLYTALAPQINLFRSFVDSGWTIVADNTLVKLLYRNLIDIFGRNSNTTTTLVEQNGGVILRPLAPGVISSCGVLDAENGTYTLDTSSNAQNYFFNYNYDNCFIVRANGVTIDGANMTVRTLSNSSSSIAVIATSTPSQDGTYNAFTNLTIKNIRFAGFANALNANGTDNASGAGGNGGVVSFATSTLNANMFANGGNGTANGGNGGVISISNVNARGFMASTTLSANGGSSTSCGNGGNAGTVNTTRSSYNIVSVQFGSGSTSGCPSNSSAGHSGSSGQGHVDIGGNNSASNDPVADAKAVSSPNTSVSSKSGSGSSGSNLFTYIRSPLFIPVAIVKPLVLKDLPPFGGTGKNSFSFESLISDFLFAPLQKSLTTSLGLALNKYFASVGISTQQDLLQLRNKPITLPVTSLIPAGLITVTTSDGAKVPLQATFGTTLKPIVEQATVTASTTYTFSLIPTSKGSVTISFNGTKYSMKKGSGTAYSATVILPSPGSYTLTSTGSSLSLLLKVTLPNITTQTVEKVKKQSVWSVLKFW